MALVDVGCGPGTITVDLARRVDPGPVVGLDTAAAVIDVARAEAGASAPANVRFAVGDVYDLAFDDATFDVVHAHQVLQHLGDPVAALTEMRRVCRPGGIVAARDGDYPAMTWFPPDPVLDRWQDLYCRTASGNGGEPAAGRRLAAWARAAGFADVTAGASAWCFCAPADRQWWGALWADRITGSDLAAHVVAQDLAGPDELQEVADAWRRWAQEPDGWFAVLHGEILCRA
jgi:SAM-dependent methyltransferase